MVVEQTDADVKVGMLAAEKAKYNLGVQPSRAFGPIDTKLWTKRQAEMFRTQKATAKGSSREGSSYASKYMRWWFAEHAGQTAPTKSAPRTAYAIFSQRRVAEVGCGAGDKKQLRKIGAEWKAMDDASKEPFTAELELGKEQWEAASDVHDAQLSQWRKDKRVRQL